MISILFFDPRKAFLENGRLVRDAFIRLNDLIRRTGGTKGDYMGVPSHTVAELQAIAASEEDRPEDSAIALCSDETGGATLAFFVPGANEWRRVQDRALVS